MTVEGGGVVMLTETAAAPPAPTPALAAKLERARDLARGLGSAAVAVSGGVDSALALRLVHEALGERCVAVTARSPSFAADEVAEVERLVAHLGVRHLFVDSEEVTLKGYRQNPENRCFICKTEVYAKIRAVADREGLRAIVDGVIADDLDGGDRPGLEAGRRAGVRSLLAEVGLGESDVREAARALGLSVWDKPAMACLSSRIPFGEEITEAKLGQVAALESALRALGFRGARVRYHGAIARIELAAEDLARAVSPGVRDRVVAAAKGAGFLFATLDLEGYRSGGLPVV